MVRILIFGFELLIPLLRIVALSTRFQTVRKTRPVSRRRKISFETLEVRSLLAIDLVSAADPSIVSDTGDNESSSASISADGRYVAFESDAGDLVPNDTNFRRDVFVRDLQTGTVTLVSTGARGQGNGDSSNPDISADGRYVVFESSSLNLTSGITYSFTNIFVRDLVNGTTSLVSVGAQLRGIAESRNPTISDDGRYIAFQSDSKSLTPGLTVEGIENIYVRDMVGQTTTLVSARAFGIGNLDSVNPVISGNGQFVAFESFGTNFLSTPTNGNSHIFVRDLVNQNTEIVSAGFSGEGGGNSFTPTISFDGRYIGFQSLSRNLVAGDSRGNGVYIRDMTSDTITLGSLGPADEFVPGSVDYQISNSGRYFVFRGAIPKSSSSGLKIFVRDLLGETTTFVGDAPSENFFTSLPSYSVGVSDDGATVVFSSAFNGLIPEDNNYVTDVFVHDLTTNVTTGVSLRDKDLFFAGGNNYIAKSSTSANGRYVAFESGATNLVPGVYGDNIFVRDLKTGKTVLASIAGNGQADAHASSPSISSDGRYVAYSSSGRDLSIGDESFYPDIFVRDLQANTTTLVSVGRGTRGAETARLPSISADGRYVAFQSSASNLTKGDTNDKTDIFVRDIELGITTRVSVSGKVQGNGSSFNASISADGRYVTFESDATNLVTGDTNRSTDVFVHDTVLGTTTLVSKGYRGLGNGKSSAPSISANGRYITYQSVASNLVPGISNRVRQIYVYDLQTDTTELVSKLDQTPGRSYSDAPQISEDGRFVVFTSFSDNLAKEMLPGQQVLVKDLLHGTIGVVSKANDGPSKGFTSDPQISADGRYVLFSSDADNLIDDYIGGRSNIFRAENVVFVPSAPLPAEMLIAFDPQFGRWYGSDLKTRTSLTLAEWGPAGHWRDGLVADFNGDGISDIAARNVQGEWVVGIGQSDSYDYFHESVWAEFPFQRSYSSVTTADVNNDGKADLVVFDKEGGNRWLVLRSDNGRFRAQEVAWHANAPWLDFQVADFNGDGQDDLAARAVRGGGKGSVWFVSLIKPNGGIAPRQRWGRWLGNAWQDVQAADYDGDGKADLVGRNPRTGEWQWAQSTGTGFKNHSLGHWKPDSEAGWHNVLIADLNGDGKDDIVGQTAVGQWFWIYQERKQDVFSRSLGRWNADEDYQSVFAADLDRDGVDELFGRRGTDGVWRIDTLTKSENKLRSLAGDTKSPDWDESVDWLYADLAYGELYL